MSLFNTLCMNYSQKAQNNSPSTTMNGVTFTNNGDGSWTVFGTATGGNAHVYVNQGSQMSGYNHIMIVKGCPSGGSTNTYYLEDPNMWQYPETGDGVRFVYNKTYGTNIRILIKNGTTVNGLKFWPKWFDLTDMYGAGNEPTIEEFNRIYNGDYYPFHKWVK